MVLKIFFRIIDERERIGAELWYSVGNAVSATLKPSTGSWTFLRVDLKFCISLFPSSTSTADSLGELGEYSEQKLPYHCLI